MLQLTYDRRHPLHLLLRDVLRWVVLLFVLTHEQPTHGAVIYSYTADRSAYAGPVGGVVPVNIYLQETLTGSSNPFIVAHGGLTTAGAAVDFQSDSGGSASQIGNASFSIPSAFGGPQTVIYNQSGNDLEFNESIALGATALTPAAGKILLGVLDVSVGSGTTTYRLTSLAVDTIPQTAAGLGGVDGNTTTAYINGTYFDLDVSQTNLYTGADSAAPFDFTVAPVPEPAAMSLTFFTFVGLHRRCRRRVASN